MRGYNYIIWIDGILLIGGFIFYKVFCRWAFGKKTKNYSPETGGTDWGHSQWL